METVEKKVERFGYFGGAHGMEELEDGPYVVYYDYEKLEQLNSESLEACKKMFNQMKPEIRDGRVMAWGTGNMDEAILAMDKAISNAEAISKLNR